MGICQNLRDPCYANRSRQAIKGDKTMMNMDQRIRHAIKNEIETLEEEKRIIEVNLNRLYERLRKHEQASNVYPNSISGERDE